MDIIEVLAKNQRFFKIATIEKEIGLKPTILTRMIARKKMNEIYKDKIEKWWNEFVFSLQNELTKIEDKVKMQELKSVQFKTNFIVQEESPVIIDQSREQLLEKSRYDFQNEKYLVIEKYTLYPLKNKPTNKFEQVKWLKEKKEADYQIKLAWDQFKKG